MSDTQGLNSFSTVVVKNKIFQCTICNDFVNYEYNNRNISSRENLIDFHLSQEKKNNFMLSLITILINMLTI